MLVVVFVTGLQVSGSGVAVSAIISTDETPQRCLPGDYQIALGTQAAMDSTIKQAVVDQLNVQIPGSVVLANVKLCRPAVV